MLTGTPATASGVSHQSVDIVLLNDFNLTEFSAVCDVVGCVNALQAATVLSLSMRTPNGGTVISAEGRVRISCDALDFRQGPGVTVFVGGSSVKSHAVVLAQASQAAEQAGRSLVVLSDAVAALHSQGRFAGRSVIVPWDDAYLDDAAWHSAVSSELLYIRHGALATGAGMGSTYELMTTVLCDMAGLPVATPVMDRLKMAELRSPLTRQRRTVKNPYRIENQAFAWAVELIEDNLENPANVTAIATTVGMSTRQLERHFRRTFGLSPVRFQRKKQLERARWLIENTRVDIAEIGMACGFSSSSQFSKKFREFWGMSPTQSRKMQRSTTLA